MGCRKSKILPVIDLQSTRLGSNVPLGQQVDNHFINIVSIDYDSSPTIDDIATITALLDTKTNQIDLRLLDESAYSQTFRQQRQNVIDNQMYREIIDSWRPTSIQQLVDNMKDLSKNKTTIEKAWVIFYWIACNIEYDVISYFSKNYADQSAEGVFRTRKGVCAGYGNLYKKLADNIGLPCETCGGYSKGYSFELKQAKDKKETDHAWNVIEINNRSYLIESTWAAGSLDTSKHFEKEFNSYFFLSRPDEMIYHHLPEEDKFQLLSHPISHEQFLMLPKTYPAYFEHQIEVLYPKFTPTVTLLNGKSFTIIMIKTPADVGIIADLKLNDTVVKGGERVQFDKSRRIYCCYFAPQSVGFHKIMIYAKRKSTDGNIYSSARLVKILRIIMKSF
ncbi:unnamed protein product [Didymodactylos carnosus]|uniref:Transglutaminase-like domain-containing protein n=1 Tax=Didymodactylos carnosus TaxID=1234261 RepID=A0A814J4M0_9BILA|nr:unnamed protein product [Didymodactylos carnosus]CAF1033130.1 unnamed protein product [Didymodactylos carnosus]CAF3611698.1 unnamed protein product [Didymodactylos carnosus]CAF3803870.1 unnamed protein product [Didymodactylos carnosus]